MTAIQTAKFSCVLILASLALSHCASNPKKEIDTESSDSSHSIQSEDLPDQPESNLDTSVKLPTVYGPTPANANPLVVVLGPGLAKAYAYAGFFRALDDAKLPIGAIVGTEMGALIGALYTTSRTVNEFEWNLTKLEDDTFFDSGFSIGSLFSQNSKENKLERKLDKIFKDKEIEAARLPLYIGVLENGEFKLLQSGRIADQVRHSMSVSPSFKPKNTEESISIESSAVKRGFPVEEAKALALGPVVVVSVLTEDKVDSSVASTYRAQMSLSEFNSRDEIESADIVVRPKVDAVSFDAFKKKALAIYAGKVATNLVLNDLKRLSGR